MKLNLGCGKKPMEGFVNVDYYDSCDMRVDLNVFPWPWENDSIEEVYSCHWLEHVEDYERTIRETFRILRPNGVLHCRVPHHRAPSSVVMAHKWRFSTYTPRDLCAVLPYQFEGRQLFHNGRVRLNYPHSRALRIMISWMANRRPLEWDILGLPCEEVEFWVYKRPIERQ